MSDEDHHDLKQDRGLQISADSLYLDIYRLVSVLGGSRTIAESNTLNPRSSLYELVQRFERSEAARLLLNIAVVCRSVLDYGWVEPIDGNQLRVGGDVVGWLEPMPGASREDLHFREACNKVIHAVGITFSRAVDRPTPFPHLGTEVRVTGKKRNSRWIASIDILVFAECAYNVL